MNKAKLLVVVLITIAILVVFFNLLSSPAKSESKEIVINTWEGYKYYFIDEEGRVKRPKENDTVSEGQAYAMLRAAWMNDKDTFDKCYRWTEENLSRINKTGDNLLAWHWKSGKVLDYMPASDADIDYALSLVFADSIWKGKSPSDLADYGEKARKVLDDVLRFETYKTKTGRLYLSPWIIENAQSLEKLPLNPSYYSPAHFRVFQKFTRDKRWEGLVKTTYFMLDSLSQEFRGEKGIGLIPDWCLVDNSDRFYPMEGKSDIFGWESVRVPFRVAMDYFWFGSKEAKRFFNKGLRGFIEKEWREKGILFCEYDYTGKPVKKYENPLFYAAYASVLLATGSDYSDQIVDKAHSFIKKDENGWLYLNEKEYYVNSLAWISDGFIAKVVRKIST